MKIGIMGGTFDPIHKGHLMLALYAKKQFELDKVWFMPNGNPPHKSNDDIESKTRHRVEMVRRAIEQETHFELQLYEVERKEVNYSYSTMEHFRETYPEEEFYFILGADSLFTLEKWVCPDRLLRTCVILAACRDDKSQNDVMKQIEYLNQKFDADIRLLCTPHVDISSSDIRGRMKDGQDVKDMLPAAVYEYILENHLYADEFQQMKEKVRQSQKDSRFTHTIGVMETAIQLAERYHEDVTKAEMAALLHDCAKELYPGLQHASKGAELAQTEYGIEDEEILDAIRWHTTGRPNMTKLDKIIYIADYIEPNRCQAPNLDEIRRLAYEDLDECLYYILKATLAYLETRDDVIDPITEQTYLYYKNLLNK